MIGNHEIPKRTIKRMRNLCVSWYSFVLIMAVVTSLDLFSRGTGYIAFGNDYQHQCVDSFIIKVKDDIRSCNSDRRFAYTIHCDIKRMKNELNGKVFLFECITKPLKIIIKYG